MQYDPAHRTSSVTSTTSTSTSSSTFQEQSNILSHFDDYSFDFTPVPSSSADNDPIKKDHKRSNEINSETNCLPIYLQQGTHIQQYQPNHIVIPHTMSINIASTSPPPSPPPSTISFNLEDTKRANHLISEQKRRNTIRLGFKDLTEIIPTLKNVNNSKSTILFKAVEFIKHLDRRNKALQDKLASLQIRVQVEKTIKKTPQHHHLIKQNQLSLPPDTISALIEHKNQQKQLEELQLQLLKKSPYRSKNLHNASTLIVPHDNDDTFY